MKKMVQDKRIKATYPPKIKVIAIAVVEDYAGESGREMIIPPVQEISNLVSAAYLSLGEEEDAACLSMRAMGEQSHGFKACLF